MDERTSKAELQSSHSFLDPEAGRLPSQPTSSNELATRLYMTIITTIETPPRALYYMQAMLSTRWLASRPLNKKLEKGKWPLPLCTLKRGYRHALVAISKEGNKTLRVGRDLTLLLEVLAVFDFSSSESCLVDVTNWVSVLQWLAWSSAGWRSLEVCRLNWGGSIMAVSNLIKLAQR